MLFLLGLLTIKGPENGGCWRPSCCPSRFPGHLGTMGLTISSSILFRATTSSGVTYHHRDRGFAMPLLGILALDKLIQERIAKQHAKPGRYAIGITLGLTLLIAVAPGIFHLVLFDERI